MSRQDSFSIEVDVPTGDPPAAARGAPRRSVPGRAPRPASWAPPLPLDRIPVPPPGASLSGPRSSAVRWLPPPPVAATASTAIPATAAPGASSSLPRPPAPVSSSPPSAQPPWLTTAPRVHEVPARRESVVGLPSAPASHLRSMPPVSEVAPPASLHSRSLPPALPSVPTPSSELRPRSIPPRLPEFGVQAASVPPGFQGGPARSVSFPAPSLAFVAPARSHRGASPSFPAPSVSYFPASPSVSFAPTNDFRGRRRRSRGFGPAFFLSVILSMTGAALVIEFRPEWIPTPAVHAIELARSEMLGLLGRGPSGRALPPPAPVVPSVMSTAPSPIPGPGGTLPTVAAPPPLASAPRVASEPPVFSVSSLPVAKDSSPASSRMTARPAPPPRAPVAAPVRVVTAAVATPVRTRPVAPQATPARPETADEAPVAEKRAPTKPAAAAPAAPAPAPGSLDDLIRKAVEADAKKK